ncbi:hypothetical protein ACF1FE_35650 [Streptomyces griseofuscus]|uniref:hypothetical protein n=1 Tax=Streptomyces griseofuscus TaxID=146922 RepID=UPI0033C452FB
MSSRRSPGIGQMSTGCPCGASKPAITSRPDAKTADGSSRPRPPRSTSVRQGNAVSQAYCAAHRANDPSQVELGNWTSTCSSQFPG